MEFPDFNIPDADPNVMLMNREKFETNERFVTAYVREVPVRDTPISVSVSIQRLRIAESDKLSLVDTQVQSYIKGKLPSPDRHIGWGKYPPDQLLEAVQNGLVVIHLKRVERKFVPTILAHTRPEASGNFASTGHAVSRQFATFLAKQALDHLKGTGHYVSSTP